MNIEDIKEPYWYDDEPSEFPFLDFNREIVPPGKNPIFKEGAVGIRIDDDFWSVVALPYSWKEYTIQEIVKKLWPSIYDEASFGPDTGGDNYEHKTFFPDVTVDVTGINDINVIRNKILDSLVESYSVSEKDYPELTAIFTETTNRDKCITEARMWVNIIDN